MITGTGGLEWAVGEPSESMREIDSATALDIENAARRLADRYHGHEGMRRIDDHELLVQCEVALRVAAPSLLASLLSFRVSGSPDGILLLRHLPVDDPLPPTPSSGAYDGPWGDLAVSTVAQLMIMSCLGDVIAYEDEKDGRLVQDICPVPGAETRQENTGSCLLELHTEDGFHPNKPHFISLMCLRADHERRALTVAAGVKRALPLLPREHARVLFDPVFRIRLASSFVGTDRDVYSEPLPVLSGSSTDPDLCVDFHAMEAMTEDGERALEELRGHMMGSLVGSVLEPGDLLVIDNRRAVHGRTSFTPRYDGEDRWLRRCFAVADIRPTQPHLRPESRVHEPLLPA